jgi:hypothetical protein
VASLTLAGALAGCSDDPPAGPTASTGATDTAGTDDAPTASSDPNAGLKNGTQLKAALLTKKDLPAGFKVSKNLVRDTADAFGPAAKAVKPSKAACKQLDTNVWIGGAGIGSAAFAQTGYTNGSGLEIDAEIDSYRGTDADKVMINLEKLFSVCSSYKTTTPGVGKSTVKVVQKAGPKVGDNSIKAILTSPVWQDGSTLIAIQVEKSVVSLLYSSSKPVSATKAAKLAETMAKRLAE